MRDRKQAGYIYKRGCWWVLRYRDQVVENGQLVRKQLARQLMPVREGHERLKRPPQDVEDEAERWLTENVNDSRRTSIVLTTIGDFVANIYLKFVEEQKRPSTLKGYRDMWERHWQPRCEKELLRDVRTCDVQRWLDSIATRDKTRKETTLSRESLKHLKSLLSGIFAHAKRQGYFDGVNPVVDTAIPPSPKGGDTYAYSLEEITRMLMLLPEPAATIVTTAAFTGARRGEIRGMRWENFHDGAIYIENSVWESHVLDPKTRASKAPIPVIPTLAAVLKRHRERIGNPVAGPMFPATNGQPVSLNNVANRQILPTLSRCAICSKDKPAHIDATVNHKFQRDVSLPVWHGWHAFRRGLATNLYRLGVSDKVIQAILRHSNLATTMNVYVKTVSEDSVNAMQALEALMCAERAPEQSKTDIPVVN